MIDRLARIEANHAELTARLAAPEVLADPRAVRDTGKALAELEPVVALARRYRALEAELGGARELLLSAGSDEDVIDIPVVGRVAAGLPLLAEENVVDTVRVDRMLVRGGREVFGLRVTGDSMIEAGILAGDYIFVRKQSTADRGDVVVALIGDEATVKHFYPERDYVRFQPANSKMAPILVRASDFKSTMLLGKVVGVYRRL